MKKLLSILVLLVIAVPSEAQNFEFSSITTNVGEGALTSGFDVTVKFENENRVLEFTGNHQRVYTAYKYRIPYGLSVSGTGGFFKNTPWIGPQATWTPLQYITFMYWEGWGAGELGKPAMNLNFFFRFGGVYFTIKNLTVSDAAQKFQGEILKMPGCSYSFAVNHSFGMSVGVDYLINTNAPLFRIGLSYQQ